MSLSLSSLPKFVDRFDGRDEKSYGDDVLFKPSNFLRFDKRVDVGVDDENFCAVDVINELFLELNLLGPGELTKSSVFVCN